MIQEQVSKIKYCIVCPLHILEAGDGGESRIEGVFFEAAYEMLSVIQY